MHRLNQTVTKLLNELPLITSAIEAPMQTEQEKFSCAPEGREHWRPMPSLPLNWIALTQSSNTNSPDTISWSATDLRDGNYSSGNPQ
jgi:hypothetical protein